VATQVHCLKEIISNLAILKISSYR